MSWQTALLDLVLGRDIAPLAAEVPLASAGDVGAVTTALDAAFLVALDPGQRKDASLLAWLQTGFHVATSTARDILPPLVQRALRDAGSTDATGIAFLHAVAAAICGFAVNALTDLAAEAAASSHLPGGGAPVVSGAKDEAPPLHRELATLMCVAPHRVSCGETGGGSGGGFSWQYQRTSAAVRSSAGVLRWHRGGGDTSWGHQSCGRGGALGSVSGVPYRAAHTLCGFVSWCAGAEGGG